jgi:hypothetical protein
LDRRLALRRRYLTFDRRHAERRTAERRTTMKRIRAFLITATLAITSVVVFAPSAGAVLCNDHPGGCCEDVTVLGKTILHIDC